MAKKRKKNHVFIKILIICILLCGFFYHRNYINNKLNKAKDPIKNDYLEIVDTSEADSDIVQSFFADGMNLEQFKKINSKNDNYVKSTHDFEKIYYNFEEKLHYFELEEYFNKLNNSDIVNLEIIGSSLDNRNIYSIEIGKGTDTLLIDANIHAAEVGNTIILLKYMVEIVNKYESNDEEIVELLNNVKLVVLPCINPDGYEIYSFGIESINNRELWVYKEKDNINFSVIKCNANGVDINRNMPTQNAGLYYKSKSLINSVSFSKTNQNSAYYGGTELGSEPETKALMYFMLKHYKNTFAYINMHSQGRVIYQGKPNLSEDFNNLSKKFANYFSEYTNYYVHDISSEEVAEGNDGSATDFMAELANGLKFSSITGRLSTTTYENNNVSLEYKYPVITVETIRTFTSIPSYYKDEYNNRNYYELFTNILKKEFDK